MIKIISSLTFCMLTLTTNAAVSDKSEVLNKSQRFANSNVIKYKITNEGINSCATGIGWHDGACSSVTAYITYCCSCSASTAQFFADNIAASQAARYAALTDQLGC